MPINPSNLASLTEKVERLKPYIARELMALKRTRQSRQRKKRKDK